MQSAVTETQLPPKPRYQFEAYLVHLRGGKEAAQRALADAQQRHVEEQQKLSEMVEARERLQQSHRRWKEELDAGLEAAQWTVAEMGARQDHLRRLRSDIEDQQRAVLSQQRTVQRADRAEEEARQKLQDVANEVKVHEERKERWLEELQREERRLEQKRIEEISQAMHERRRRDDR
jgi:flagellar biosynthesis chaperone FliJ